MWKDFFIFSRAERRLLTLLLVLAAVLAVSLLAYRHYAPQSRTMPEMKLWRLFGFPWRKADSLRRQGRRESHSHVSGKPAAMFPFDPNTADSSQLTQLGLSDFVVRNILKYRARGGGGGGGGGGVFRTSESLAKSTDFLQKTIAVYSLIYVFVKTNLSTVLQHLSLSNRSFLLRDL